MHAGLGQCILLSYDLLLCIWLGEFLNMVGQVLNAFRIFVASHSSLRFAFEDLVPCSVVKLLIA